MSRVFEAEITRIATESGCDWDFVVDVYNRIWDKYGEVDIDRLSQGMCKRNWSARGVRECVNGEWHGGLFSDVLKDLSDRSGYAYDTLLGYLADMVYDPADDSDWDYFVGVTVERDW